MHTHTQTHTQTYSHIHTHTYTHTQTTAVRRHWSLMREAVRDELLWGPAKMHELRDGVVRLVKSVSGAAALREAAEDAARRERLKVLYV